jgi:hypothetical protein
MTLPDERYRSIEWARDFLRDLLDPSKTPKVPKNVRQRAYSVLKHFPANYEMENIASKSDGKIFAAPKKSK